jgi:DNA processing protein
VTDDLRYWLGFNRVSGIGPVRLRALQDYFGGVERAWHASAEQLRAAGLDQRSTDGLVQTRARLDLDAEMQRVRQAGLSLITLDDPTYPRLLRETDGAPPLLYIKGELIPDDEWAVAIVGTRRCGHYGKEAARHFASGLAEQGITIVSGLAYGIDTIAHQAALDAGGRTLAVQGCSLDMIYPPSNTKLAKAIVAHGALLSEHPLGTRPDARHFPARNRIVSGLALSVLVIEAPRDSGALITARMAAEQGRDVFAVPGNIFSPGSAGVNYLIQNGAKLVTSVADILEELNLRVAVEQRAIQLALPEDPTERKLLDHLTAEPAHIDEISRASGLPLATVSANLVLMELKGLVRQVGGLNYVTAR